MTISLTNIKVVQTKTSQIEMVIASVSWQNLRSRSAIYRALKQAETYSGEVIITKGGHEMVHVGKGRLVRK